MSLSGRCYREAWTKRVSNQSNIQEDGVYAESEHIMIDD